MAELHSEPEMDSPRSSSDQEGLILPSPFELSTTVNEIPSSVSRSITRRLYTSHFLSTWNTRGFEFGAVIFLATIYPGTLLPMSVYALIRALSAIIFSPTVGTYIDTNNRLQVVRISIIVQRGVVVLSCVVFWVMLRYRDSLPQYVDSILMTVLIAFACIEKLCSIMNMIAVERDWVVVIGEGDESTLRLMNSQMRRIDLFCKIISPLAIALIDGWSSEVAIMTTLGINAISMPAEYALIATVYRRIPALAAPKQTQEGAEHAWLMRQATLTSRITNFAQTFASSLHSYIMHGTFLPSFSLSLLYFTVLSFAGQMTTYLLAIGITPTTLGLLRTISTAFELSATYIAPYLMSRIGPVRAGIWSQSWLIVCVTFIVGILWSTSASPAPSTLATALFVTGVVVSRVGTWSFDLCAQIIIQEEISAESRGSFSSMEASVRNVFELCRFAATILFSRADQFRYPALMTLVAVWLSGSFYAKFVRERRGHLLHMPQCLKSAGDDLGFDADRNRARGRYEALELESENREVVRSESERGSGPV